VKKSKRYTGFLIIVFSVFINLNYFAQTKTNLEMIEGLVGKSAEVIKLDTSSNNYGKLVLKFVAANDYEILQTKLISELQKNNFKLLNKKETSNLPKLIYTLDNAKVYYKNIFKDGILGTYLVERESTLDGSYFFENNNKIGKVKKFNFTVLDTVMYDDVKKLENIAYQFSAADLPNEPFFSSLLEPAIAISTAAIAIYLFFSLRSN